MSIDLFLLDEPRYCKCGCGELLNHGAAREGRPSNYINEQHRNREKKRRARGRARAMKPITFTSINAGEPCMLYNRITGSLDGPFIYLGNSKTGASMITDTSRAIIAEIPVMDRTHLIAAARPGLPVP